MTTYGEETEEHVIDLAGVGRPGAGVLAMLGRGTEATPLPSLGRVVHFVYSLQAVDNDLRLAGKHAAAMIVGLNEDGTVNLALFPDGPGYGYLQRVAHDEEQAHHTWHWPERI